MMMIMETIKKVQIQKEKLIMMMMIEQNDFHLYDTTTMKTTATPTMPTTTPLPSPPMRDGDGEDGNIDIRENSDDELKYYIYTLP